MITATVLELVFYSTNIKSFNIKFKPCDMPFVSKHPIYTIAVCDLAVTPWVALTLEVLSPRWLCCSGRPALCRASLVLAYLGMSDSLLHLEGQFSQVKDSW